MSQRDKPRRALNNCTAGVREPSEWSGGPSDLEGKTTRVGASECGQRTSFNRTREAGNRDEVEGVVANMLGSFRNGASLLANSFGVCFIDWLGDSMFSNFAMASNCSFEYRSSSNPKSISRSSTRIASSSPSSSVTTKNCSSQSQDVYISIQS